MTTTCLPRGLLAVALAASLFAVSTTSFAADADADASAGMSDAQFVASLHFQDGHVEIPAAKAHFDLGGDFQYLDKRDARRVLEQYWGNPPDDSVLGLIVPRHPALDEDGSWAVVVTYSDDGYISDADAAKIDYDELLAQLKKDDVESNEQRRKEGYQAINVIGWAVPPRYDATSKKLYWAKQLKVEGADGDTLNYDVRVLGRGGYLSLNAVAGMDELPQVRDGMQELLPMAEFDSGARYADHNPSTDKIAGYGVAALIGGGLAAKAGLFAKLGLLLAKLWKVVLIGIVALGGFVKKLFTRDKKTGTVR